MTRTLAQRLHLALLAVALLMFASCGSDDDDPKIVGPDLPKGDGRIYAIDAVSFGTVDGLDVAGVYGRAGGASQPTVILVHDVGNSQAGQEWLFDEFFETLLENGYNALTIDLRGHGLTPLPQDGRSVEQLLLTDLDNFHLEVRAAITWLRSQPSADASRLAVIGNGGGGNVAFVAMGAFPDDLKAGVAISPGLWDANATPLVIGGGLTPFAPHSMLYVVGGTDILPISDEASFSYATFAEALASLTSEPKSVAVVEGVSAHGLALLASPSLSDLVLDWLALHL
ncbi:MAG: alpha/beta fold hydrolase [Gemmatimonadetes bacterium]|nr:alpha/beta fold hydrolase [Gemmatimonadota bacterium]MBT6145385.1 alpha/beta fold hydrolase [Gemmatimonadota bacterium]MBT7859663.1 alpha/beta fold hydrolase [Gemmatimonadota bacterium]